MRRILVLHDSLMGCSVISALMYHAASIQHAKVEVVDELPEPEPIKFISYKRYTPEIPNISISDVCYKIGMDTVKKRDRQKQHRYAANRHNFRNKR